MLSIYFLIAKQITPKSFHKYKKRHHLNWDSITAIGVLQVQNQMGNNSMNCPVQVLYDLKDNYVYS